MYTCKCTLYHWETIAAISSCKISSFGKSQLCEDADCHLSGRPSQRCQVANSKTHLHIHHLQNTRSNSLMLSSRPAPCFEGFAITPQHHIFGGSIPAMINRFRASFHCTIVHTDSWTMFLVPWFTSCHPISKMSPKD